MKIKDKLLFLLIKRKIIHHPKGCYLSFLYFCKRIVHSIHWYITRTLNYYKDDAILIERDAVKIMQVLNSYFGILKWCSSYKIRKSIHDSLSSNKAFRKIFDISYTKIAIKKKFKKSYIITEENRKRKHKNKTYTPWKNYQ